MCVHDENYSESILEMVVQHFPVVTIDRQLKGVPISFVGTDNEAASRDLARYLLDRGYRKTCFVKPHAAETSTLQERIRGFKKAYNEYGLFADESLWITDIRATLPAYHQYRGEQQLAEDEEKIIEFIQNYISLFSYLFISYQMSAKPYFIGSTGIFTFCSRSHIGVYLLMFSLSNVVNFVVNTSMLSDALSLFWHSQ